MTLLRNAATLTALVALTAGCSNTAEPTPTVKPTTTASTSATPTASPTPTPDVDEFPEPVPPTPVSDGTAEAVFGDDLFADNAVADLSAKWVGLTLANKEVVTGDITPAQAVCTRNRRTGKPSCSLPFVKAAQKVAIADPTSWTLVSFTEPAQGLKGVDVEHLNRDEMRVPWEAVRTNGVDQLYVTFTATVRVTYLQDGQRFTIDGQRGYKLWLVPSTDDREDKWSIALFRADPMTADDWTDPVPAAAGE